MNRKKMSYRPFWKTSHSWIKKDKNSDCTSGSVCKRSFWIDNSGLSQVKAHVSSAGCKAKEVFLEGKTSQLVLICTNSITVSI